MEEPNAPHVIRVTPRESELLNNKSSHINSAVMLESLCTNAQQNSKMAFKLSTFIFKQALDVCKSNSIVHVYCMIGNIIWLFVYSSWLFYVGIFLG